MRNLEKDRANLLSQLFNGRGYVDGCRRQGIHCAQKTIYFEGHKLYYQVERAQSNDFLWQSCCRS